MSIETDVGYLIQENNDVPNAPARIIRAAFIAIIHRDGAAAAYALATEFCEELRLASNRQKI